MNRLEYTMNVFLLEQAIDARVDRIAPPNQRKRYEVRQHTDNNRQNAKGNYQ